MTENELNEILIKHQKWTCKEDGGECANLSNADLSNAVLLCANLRGANLSNADLSNAVLLCANLRDADLSNADLSNARLRDADLSNADLRDADLSNADLRGANLSNADLSNAVLLCANLRDADLSNAKGLPPIVCPEEGAFIGWKKCWMFNPESFGLDKVMVIAKLNIPKDAKRSSATGRKCRCDKATPMAFYYLDGHEFPAEAEGFCYVSSLYDPTFMYKIGVEASVPDFCENRWQECGPGIHFFLTQQEAIDY